VDSTAPCGNPAGVVLMEEDSSFTWTVKLRPVRNALNDSFYVIYLVLYTVEPC